MRCADTSPTQSVEYLSSSEEGIPSFVEARRSKKYMSKRTSGTFRDYLRSRGSEQQPQPQQQQQPVHQDEECGATTFNNNKKIINNNNISSSTTSSGSMSPHIPFVAGDKENRTVAAAAAEMNRKETFKRNSTRGSYSSYINNMHGFRTRSNSEEQQQQQQDDEEQQMDNEDIFARSNDDDARTNGSENEYKSSNSSFLKKYNVEDSVPRAAQFESTDDWYASASDMDDSDGALSKPYGYNAVNPVLECVNQVTFFFWDLKLFTNT